MKNKVIIILSIIIVILCVVLITFTIVLVSSNSNDNYDTNKSKYNNDSFGINFEDIEYDRRTDFLNETLKAFDGNIVDAWYKYYTWGGMIGPTNYIVAGFIAVSDEKIEEVEKRFDFRIWWSELTQIHI